MMLLAPIAVTGPAQAKVSGANGQIVFGRFDPAVGDQVIYAVNPDGSHLRQVIPGPSMAGECPHWSPDGSLIATCGAPDGGATMLIDPDTGSFQELAGPDPTLFTPCFVWSPNAERLACESFGQTDPSRNGIYTIRSSDGSGLTRVTSNPDGDDLPGDYSPNGKQIVFGRTDPARPDRANQAVFVVNIDGSGLRRIAPWGLGACCGSWSPDGRWILFAGGGALYVVHPDGTGLQQVRLDTGGSRYFATEPSWSPDGTMMVFSLFLPKNGALDVYTTRADGTNLVQVTTALPGAADLGEGDELPDWGPHPLAT
jgi:Tol biopolymer transport system component